LADRHVTVSIHALRAEGQPLTERRRLPHAQAPQKGVFRGKQKRYGGPAQAR
jgi:hypothetical protein